MSYELSFFRIISHTFFLKSFFNVDCVDFTMSQVDNKSFFFKRLITENPRNGVKHILPMMEGKTKNNQFLKSSLTTLRQFQLFVFQASSPDEIMFFRPIKTKETGRSGASLLDTLYNVAKASTPPSTPRHQPARDLPDVVRRRAVEHSNVEFKIERPWKFCQVSNSAIFVFCNPEIYLSYLTYSAHCLIGSRIIESAACCN